MTYPFGPPGPCDLSDFIPVAPNHIADLLSQLDPTKSPGPDGITGLILKIAAPVISSSLARIFNCSLESGTMPQAFKCAHISPILKKKDGNRSDPANYRGISLNSILSKVLEKVVKAQLLDHFESRNTFSDFQFGFRQGRSTEQLLTLAVDSWYRARDKGLVTAIVFIDLSKAFDRVKHQQLLFLLHNAGISGIALHWFASYLTDRRQRVVIKDESSPYLDVSRGVPQGSILGPILFNLVVANLPELIRQFESTLLLFADDKTLFSSASSIREALGNVSKSLTTIASTLAKSGLSVNAQKTRLMLLMPPSLSEPTCPITIMLDSKEIAITSSIRCLGVLVSKNLSWSLHVDQIATKVSRKLGVLRQMSRQMSPAVRRMFFLSVVQPDLEYAIVRGFGDNYVHC